MGFFTGTPPESQIIQTPGTRAPLFNFAKTFGDYLKGLIGQPAPHYQGQIDPGLSPTMQMLGQMLQGYAMRTPEVIAGASGGLPGGYQAAFRPPPAFDPSWAYNFAYRPVNFGGQANGGTQPFAPPQPQSQPGMGGGFPAFGGGAGFNFGFQGPPQMPPQMPQSYGAYAMPGFYGGSSSPPPWMQPAPSPMSMYGGGY